VQAVRRIEPTPRVIASAAALVIVVVGAILVYVLTRDSNVPARGSLAGALPGAAEVQDLLGEVPQHDNILGGNARAPVTMVEYIDLQSPACRQFQTHVLPGLISRYVLTGTVKIEARLTAFIGHDSERGRSAAIGAGEQNKLFDFVQLLYVNQRAENSGWLDDGMVTDAAASIPGLDVPLLRHERHALIVEDVERGFESDASGDKVTSTPTILVGKTGKALHRVTLATPSDERAVAAAIEAAHG
jgi:hypothetical protein